MQMVELYTDKFSADQLQNFIGATNYQTLGVTVSH